MGLLIDGQLSDNEFCQRRGKQVQLTIVFSTGTGGRNPAHPGPNRLVLLSTALQLLLQNQGWIGCVWDSSLLSVVSAACAATVAEEGAGEPGSTRVGTPGLMI